MHQRLPIQAAMITVMGRGMRRAQHGLAVGFRLK
jgi:hypothetical protein